ncbi:hypothetical protein HD806DRAFT_290912 [Xylariaceae sp. AK1471]|nr:hypothetical protein HD806DRAFT_290912 [Xylariaceae sp. AK1471]
MAAVDILAPNDTFKAFATQANVFMRHGKKAGGIQYKETVGAEQGADAFVFNDDLFMKLQVYIKSSMLFPPNEEQFKATYPYANFSKWLKEDTHYKHMYQVLTPIHQHCATYYTDGIAPLIALSHAVGEYSGDAATLIEALKEQLDIVCDKSIPLSSRDAAEARQNATDILRVLQENGTALDKKCKILVKATETFASQTTNDEIQLKGLNGMLETAMPQSKVDQAVAAQMAETRKKLNDIIKQQETEARKAENAAKPKWYWFIPPVGGFFANKSMRDHNKALRDLQEATESYQKTVAAGNDQKLVLIQAVDNVRALTSTIKGVTDHIEAARQSLKNILDGLGQMSETADTMIKKLEGLSSQVKPEAPGSQVMTKLHMDAAVKSWNTVVHVAKEFAKTGILEDAPLPVKTKSEPVILAAHYGGQDVTTMANMQFCEGTKIIISLADLPFVDPWLNNRKSLSLVYRFNNEFASWRVFICAADSHKEYTLKADDNMSNQPEGVSYPANLGSSVPSMIQIHAVIYGLRQITDPLVFEKLYRAAAKSEEIRISNSFFNAEGGNDPWHGVGKSAAVIYSINGSVRSISGREYQTMRFSF